MSAIMSLTIIRRRRRGAPKGARPIGCSLLRLLVNPALSAASVGINVPTKGIVRIHGWYRLSGYSNTIENNV